MDGRSRHRGDRESVRRRRSRRASGSVIGQGNNVFIFPGVGLGAIVSEAREISGRDVRDRRPDLLVSCVGEERLALGAIYPSQNDLREVSFRIACAVVRTARDAGLGAQSPTPRSEGDRPACGLVPELHPDPRAQWRSALEPGDPTLELFQLRIRGRVELAHHLALESAPYARRPAVRRACPSGPPHGPARPTSRRRDGDCGARPLDSASCPWA